MRFQYGTTIDFAKNNDTFYIPIWNYLTILLYSIWIYNAISQKEDKNKNRVFLKILTNQV